MNILLYKEKILDKFWTHYLDTFCPKNFICPKLFTLFKMYGIINLLNNEKLHCSYIKNYFLYIGKEIIFYDYEVRCLYSFGFS